MGVKSRVDIDAPPEEVFDYVADLSRHSEWANPKANLRVEEVSGGPPAAGSKYRSSGIFLGKPVSADLEVTAFERPTKFAYSVSHHQAGKKDVHFENTYRFGPKDRGTLIEKETDSDGNPIIGFLATPAIRSDAMKSLKRLKASLEGRARP